MIRLLKKTKLYDYDKSAAGAVVKQLGILLGKYTKQKDSYQYISKYKGQQGKAEMRYRKFKRTGWYLTKSPTITFISERKDPKLVNCVKKDVINIARTDENKVKHGFNHENVLWPIVRISSLSDIVTIIIIFIT